jgi:hypothetical protein
VTISHSVESGRKVIKPDGSFSQMATKAGSREASWTLPRETILHEPQRSRKCDSTHSRSLSDAGRILKLIGFIIVGYLKGRPIAVLSLSAVAQEKSIE